MAKNLTATQIRNLLAKLTAAAEQTLTGATNASPSVLNIAAHGLKTLDVVAIYSVTGNTALNGVFSVLEGADADHFSLKTYPGLVAVNGNGVTSGGKVRRLTTGWTPGDLEDIHNMLNRVKSPHLADKDRPNSTLESTIQTLIGA